MEPEFAHPYQVLSPHVEVSIASPTGTSLVDPISVDLFKDDVYCQEFFNTEKDLWTNTQKLDAFLGRANEFDVIFIVGGFGRKSQLVDKKHRKADTINIQQCMTLQLTLRLFN